MTAIPWIKCQPIDTLLLARSSLGSRFRALLSDSDVRAPPIDRQPLALQSEVG